MATYRFRHIRHRLTFKNEQTDTWETRPEEVLYRQDDIQGRPAALQAFDSYLARWEAEDPANRHVSMMGYVRATLFERPAGCSCRVCETGGWAEEQDRPWWTWSWGAHWYTSARIDRADQVVARSKTPTWAVVMRKQEPPSTFHKVVSEHTTKAEARRGLAEAARIWRDYRVKTAVLQDDTSYVLKTHRVPQFRLAIEPLPLTSQAGADAYPA
jgi:hypothetical protein